MEEKRIKPALIFGILCTAFLFFSVLIYLNPQTVNKSSQFTDNAAKGRLVWQKYNCQSCHQLYGLGGYLGPDLTNVYSKFNGDQTLLHSFLNSGIRQMPAFELSEQEEKLLFEFLKSTDKSGKSDPRSFTVKPDGMIKSHGKK